MTLEVLDSITVRLGGKSHTLEPGETIDLPTDKARLLLERAPGKVRAITSTIHPGDSITWHRAGMVQTGVVDFLHLDTDGVLWAFVTIGQSGAAVNVKFATVRTDVTPLSPISTDTEGRGV